MFRVSKHEIYMVKTGTALSFQVLSLIAITMANDTVEIMMIIQKKRKLDILNRIVKIKTGLTSLMWKAYV